MSKIKCITQSYTQTSNIIRDVEPIAVGISFDESILSVNFWEGNDEIESVQFDIPIVEFITEWIKEYKSINNISPDGLVEYCKYIEYIPKREINNVIQYISNRIHILKTKLKLDEAIC